MTETIDVIEAIAAGRYENKVPYRTDNVPVDEDNMTVRQAREHKEARVVRRREQAALHRIEEARLNDLFRADLERQHNVTGHPKASLVFSLAWQDGHSSGYSEVANRYSELVELITP